MTTFVFTEGCELEDDIYWEALYEAVERYEEGHRATSAD